MSEVFDNERFRKLLLKVPVKAIELLYEHYYNSLLLLARNLTKDDIASKDIIQDTFTHIWEIREQLAKGHDRSIEHYLVRVVKYKSITYYHQVTRENIEKRKLVNGHEFSGTEKSIEEEIVRQEIVQQVKDMIASFPKRERECLLMRIEDEMQYSQIAEKLNVTQKAVERTLSSAYNRLRELWLKKR
jgi:RNA polymerase sigma-70 factor (ECF subfamily)